MPPHEADERGDRFINFMGPLSSSFRVLASLPLLQEECQQVLLWSTNVMWASIHTLTERCWLGCFRRVVIFQNILTPSHTTPGEHKSQSLKRGEFSFLHLEVFTAINSVIFRLENPEDEGLRENFSIPGLSDSGYPTRGCHQRLSITLRSKY